MTPAKTLQIPCFDLDQIADSGQCFRMTPLSVHNSPGQSAYSIISGRRYLELIQERSAGISQVSFFCPEQDLDFWFRYFDLDTDYQSFLNSIDPKDLYLTEAGRYGGGIRILRQDLWEMIITFIISQQKTIPAIRSAVERLSQKYGEPLSTENGKTFWSFPTPRQLSTAAPEELLELKLGYRAKYISRVVQDTVSGKLDLEILPRLSYQEAMDYLIQFYGIGVKVANCICLFGLHHIEAFPVDTWIQQILMAEYFPKHPRKYKKLPKSQLYPAMIREHFGKYPGYAGVMQQYIFYFARSQSRSSLK